MPRKNREFFPWIIAFIVLFFVAAPYFFAFTSGSGQTYFGGFLLNPIDGNTYLAKMRQGWDGAWRYRLAYTAEPGEGAYLNLFYLTLGHVARLLRLPLLLTFHLARWFSTGILLWALWRFYGRIFQDASRRRLAYALAALGSGMGWLLLPMAQFTADFWVAETYPFLSAFTNPHFPLGLALMLWLITPGAEVYAWARYLKVGGAALLLSIIAPFGVVIALMVLGAQGLWQIRRTHTSFAVPARVIAILICGLPFLIYTLWVVHSDPVYAIWDAQNLTPSPAWWDLLISLSPALPIAALGLWKTRKKAAAPTVLVLWLVVGLALLVIPWNLQRRFMMGLYIPVAGLAAWSLEQWVSSNAKGYRFRVLGLFLLALPTNFIILMTAVFGIQNLDDQIYLAQSEMHALNWLDEHSAPDALILAVPDIGLLIPAHTGRRVIYGHPFETAFADQEKQAVQRFFAGALNLDEIQAFIADRGVDYIFVGPRAASLGQVTLPIMITPVYASDGVTIYQTGNGLP